MKRILAVCPSPLDATSFYRGLGPLAALQRTKCPIELIIDPEASWPTLRTVDLVFFQRPHTGEHISLLRKAKDMSLPVWTDYDDLLTAVPQSNPSFYSFANPDIRTNILKFLAYSDKVSFSTKYLQDRQKTATGKSIVIPNAWDDLLHPRKAPNTKPGICWRGSNSHDEDLHSVMSGLKDIRQAAKDVPWNFIGHPFWLALQQVGDANIYPWKDIIHYFKVLEDVSAQVHICPLADNDFNRAKSNIAWLEASRVGSAVVAPPWAEWSKPGVTPYGVDTFAEAVLGLLGDKELAAKQAGLSWEYIEAHYRLSKINDLRAQVIEELCK